MIPPPTPNPFFKGLAFALLLSAGLWLAIFLGVIQ